MSKADRDKWEARWAERGAPGDPSPWLVSLDAMLPRAGRALDVAGGAGRNALWLARRGLDVTLVDVSETGLELARAAAVAEGLDLITLPRDLSRGRLPGGPWDLIVVLYYLNRALFAEYPRVLAPGGLLVLCHPTRSNLGRHVRPPARFLLDDGELPRRLEGLAIVSSDEGWTSEGRHEARLVAQKSD